MMINKKGIIYVKLIKNAPFKRVMTSTTLILAMLMGSVTAVAQVTPEQEQKAKALYAEAIDNLKGKNRISQAEQNKMLELMTQSAELGYAPAQNVLGTIYYTGLIIQQDNNKALDWFLKAANQGDAVAQYHVGQMYTEGKGVAQSEQNAAVWYAKSAEQGYAPAQSYLGVLYLFGIEGIEKNHEKAMSLLDKAAKQGDKQAIQLLSKLKPATP